MTSGMQVLNEAGVELVNTSDPILLVVERGNETTMPAGGIPWRAWPACPIVFVRPRAPETWVGGFLLNRFNNGNVFISCSGKYEYVICTSASNYGIGSIGTSGLEVYDDNRKLLFSSNYQFARIKQILKVAGPYTTDRGVLVQQSAAFAGFSKMPWIGIRDATWSLPYPAGDGAASEIFTVKINSAFNVLTTTLSDTLNNNYNQYSSSFMYYPLAEIGGIP